jgi:hypothetical protein
VSESQSILDGLRSDHQAIVGMLADPAATTDTEAQREQLVMTLVRHFVAEEQYLYPAIREHLDGGTALVDSWFTRDRSCELKLKLLEARDQTVEQHASVWREVTELFTAHVQAQEAVFPQLTATVDTAELARLGVGIRGAEQLAPTRPRSVAPEPAAANKVASLIEGFVDHVRDTYSHRGV